MREAARPASLVEKIMRAADEADEPDEAKRESMYDLGILEPILLALFLGGKARRASLVRKADEPGEAMREAARPASLVEKIMRAADEADEPDEAKRESKAEKNEIKAK